MGESAGGYLAALTALVNDKVHDVGDYTEYSSEVQAACTWYPPTDATAFEYPSAEMVAAAPESLLIGKNVMLFQDEARTGSPAHLVTKDAPPFLIIHGLNDCTVPFVQGEILYNKLEEAGCDATLVAIEDAGHADIRFFQKEIWNEIILFFTS